MGLWGKIEEDAPDPFCYEMYDAHCPGLGIIFERAFQNNKSKLLRPGEKVEKYLGKNTKYRVIVVDGDFDEVIHDFTGVEDFVFEDDFYLNSCMPLPESIREYISDYPDYGVLPIYNGQKNLLSHQNYYWRIKITLPEEETTNTPPKSPSA